MLRHQNNDGAHQPARDSSINNSLVAENMESQPASSTDLIIRAEGDTAVNSPANAADTITSLARNDTIDSASDNDQPSLEILLQTLLQELQGEILAFTVMTPPSIVQIEPETYRPPHLLRINRRSRAIAAEHYYTHTTFACTHKSFYHTEFVRWLRSLPAQHRASISRIQIPPVVYPRTDVAEPFKEWQFRRLWRTVTDLPRMPHLIRHAGLASGMKSLDSIMLADCPLEEEGGVLQMGLLSGPEINMEIKKLHVELGIPEPDEEEDW
ncbi:unnamed protein product [Cercospora beticola]|nr:unnamed protein product [Cercospora beticola]